MAAQASRKLPVKPRYTPANSPARSGALTLGPDALRRSRGGGRGRELTDYVEPYCPRDSGGTLGPSPRPAHAETHAGRIKPALKPTARRVQYGAVGEA